MTAEEWVALACASPPGRKPPDNFKYFIHVVNGVAHGTDRSRLHWAKTALPDGMYTRQLKRVDGGLGAVPDFEPLKLLEDMKAIKVADMEHGHQNDPNLWFLRASENLIVPRAMVMEGLGGAKDATVFYEDKPARPVRLLGMSEFGGFVIAGIVDN